MRLLRKTKTVTIQWRKRRLARADWKARYRMIYRSNATYRRPCPPEHEKEHLRLWNPLRKRPMLDTLRVSAGVSGQCDPRIVPEEVFVTEVEPRLNTYPDAQFQANKSLYHRLFPSAGFPHCIMRCVGGVLYDANDQMMRKAQFERVEYPVVAKISIASYGGWGVLIAQSKQQLSEWCSGRSDWVLQPFLRQHAFMDALAPSDALGLNTVRVCVYRSVVDNNWVMLNAALRIGRSGTLDNETNGGLVCAVDKHGMLNRYVVDKYAVKYDKHPDVDVEFSTPRVLPQWEQLTQKAIALAEQVALVRLISSDYYLDQDGCWNPIEINLRGNTIRFEQYAGRPFFGLHTDEVIHYCSGHREHITAH
jgi:hypothetical protein